MAKSQETTSHVLPLRLGQRRLPAEIPEERAALHIKYNLYTCYLVGSLLLTKNAQITLIIGLTPYQFPHSVLLLLARYGKILYILLLYYMYIYLQRFYHSVDQWDTKLYYHTNLPFVSRACLRLFCCLLQNLHCLQRFCNNADHWFIKLYHHTDFHLVDMVMLA